MASESVGDYGTELKRAVGAVDATKALRVLYDAGRLLAYDVPAMAQTKNQIRLMYDKLKPLTHMDGNKTSIAAPIMLLSRSIEHSNRVALAYLRLRASYVIDSVANGTADDDALTQCLGNEETAFMNKVRTLRSEVSSAARVPLNAPASFASPFVEIRVIQDSGTIMTVDGQITLSPWSVHYVRRDDVGPLILSGAVEVVG